MNTLIQLTIFSGGLFLIDLFFLVGLVLSIRRFLKVRKSGSYTGGHMGNAQVGHDEAAPFYTMFSFWTAVGCIVFWIISIIMRAGDI